MRKNNLTRLRIIEMMNDGMMWGMGLGHLFVALLVFLAIAALIKYVFFR